MNAKYFVDAKGSHIVFEVAAETSKQLFERIAEIQEVFEPDKSCGLCDNTNLQYRVRTVDKNDFYELVCIDCQATLPMGQTKDGERLYPKRETKQRGWRPPYRGAKGES